MSIAGDISAELEHDCSRWATRDGRPLATLAWAHRPEMAQRCPLVRFRFEDGSAIVLSTARWGVQPPSCRCGWCLSEPCPRKD